MIQAAAYGRLGGDPRQLATKTGTVMAVGSMAVDLECRGAEEPVTQWVGLVAFGRVAEELLRHGKGDLVSVSGRIQINRWIDKGTGEECDQLQVVAEAVVSARTVRPGGRGRKRAADPSGGA